MRDFYATFIKSKKELIKEEIDTIDADFGRAFSTQKIGIHWIELQPNKRTSLPHAESLEEEFIYVVSGNPHVWINGYIYQLNPGLCVGFAAGTGIAHTFINNSNDVTELVVLGDRTIKENKCSFPINPELEKTNREIWWNNPPDQHIGPHDAKVGNLHHQKCWQTLTFITDAFESKRQDEFSYDGDTETFTEGLRLTDRVGLKNLGIWHEILKPEKRSSWPHAHKLEEEAAILLKGKAKVWLNGFTYELIPGDCVFFKPSSGIAHTIINDYDGSAEFLGFGQSNCGGSGEQLFYPLHPQRNLELEEKCELWLDRPDGIVLGDDPSTPVIKN